MGLFGDSEKKKKKIEEADELIIAKREELIIINAKKIVDLEVQLEKFIKINPKKKMGGISNMWINQETMKYNNQILKLMKEQMTLAIQTEKLKKRLAGIEK